MSGFSFAKEARLLDASAFKRVFDGADSKASHQHLLLLGRHNDLQRHRLGMVIAKKNVRLAVQRNRIKRVTRDFFRHCDCESQGMDVIVLARKGLDQLDNATLSSILRQQWNRLLQA